MNRSTIPNLPKRVLALVLAAALLTPSAFASAGTAQINTAQTLANGLVYRNTVSNHSSAGRMESFALELEPDGEVYPIMIQAAGTVYGAATINRAIRTAEELGYTVVGGINSDFFTLGSGVPNGISIEDGIYKSSPEGEHAISVVDGELCPSASPQVEITVTNERTGESVSLTHFNKWRNSSGGLYLFNEDFSTVSTHTESAGGRMIRMVVSEEDQDTPLTVNSTLTLEVTDVFETEEAQPIGEDNYILTAAYESGYWELFNSYQAGDEVTLTTTCSDANLSEAQWASGCGDIILSNGSITNSATWNYASGRAPRTAVGVQEDGTMIFYTADGRQSGYSGGLTEMDRRRRERSAVLYEVLDNSRLYRPHAEPGSRSMMNVTFRTPSEELDAEFVAGAKARGLVNLKGHRLTGGIRASIYNAMPVEGARALAEYMKEFEVEHHV